MSYDDEKDVPETSTEQFDRQLSGLVNSQRQSVYGHPLEHFEKSMRIKAALRFGYAGPPALMHAMEMIADKLARLSKSPDHFDSWLDIAGYARTAVLILDKFDGDATALEQALQRISKSDTPFADAQQRNVEVEQETYDDTVRPRGHP